MKTGLFLCKQFLFLCVLALFLQGNAALANDHGGGAPSQEGLKLIVNLGDPSNGGRYLQVQMAFESASPEVEHQISAYRPRIVHELILLLSGKTPDELLTLKGKKLLMKQIVETANHILHEDEESGIKDVFFTSFIIQ